MAILSARVQSRPFCCSTSGRASYEKWYGLPPSTATATTSPPTAAAAASPPQVWFLQGMVRLQYFIIIYHIIIPYVFFSLKWCSLALVNIFLDQFLLYFAVVLPCVAAAFWIFAFRDLLCESYNG